MEPGQRLRIVIIGGVAGGATAAARARRMNAGAEITILEKGPAVSFANCGLPYHVGGEIAERKKLLVATAELFKKRFDVDVRLKHEVTQIDRGSRTVTGIRRDTGESFTLAYDKLILSTGAAPNRPPFMEQAAANVFQLWTLDDMDATLAYIRAAEPKRAIVVGGGFVGLEVVEQLHRLEMQVTLVERNPQVLMPLDPELAKLVRLEMEQHGIEVRLGRSIAKLELSGTAANVAVLDDGSRLDCELVMVGAGVSPRIELAKASGLVIGPAGGVQVNEFMQTSDPNVYAVGDMTEVPHRLLGKTQRIPLAGPANRAGRIAGSHASSGNSSSFGPVLGTAVVRVFGLTAACTGLSEKACRAHGIEARTAVIQAPDHASYFPGAKEITLKLVYSPQTRKVLGAQGIGGAGVDKRIDVIATALHFGGSVDDLAQLDLAYAPPFGSAKDPVHMVAFTAQNDLDGAPRLKPTFDNLEGYQVVDVRNQAEIDKLPLAGAVHIPIDELTARIGELDPNKPTVVVCHSGKRAHVGACRLRTSGFKDVQNLSGGMSIRRLAD